jgi:hypothetical protein
MDNYTNKYYRYQMTFPFESHKVYKSKSVKKIVRKCYNEYKNFSDIGEGMFAITNLDKNIEYRFKIKNKKVRHLKNHKGGQLNEPTDLEQKVNEISKLEGDPELDVEDVKESEMANAFKQFSNKLDTTNQGLTNVSLKLDDTTKNIGNVTKEITKLNDNIISSSTIENKKLDELLKKTITPQPIQKNVISEGKDLFDDIDVFDANLRRLYTIRKINYMEDKNDNTCTIL